MTNIKVSEVFAGIESAASPTDKPTLVLDCIATYLVSSQGIDFDTALEYAEPLVDGVRKLVLERQNSAQNLGETWRIEVYGTEGEYIRGSSFQDNSLPGDEQQVRLRRQHVQQIKGALRTLTPQEFEIACTAIIELMGCVDPVTSPLRDDGGIDFYGRLGLDGRLDHQFPYGGIDNRVGIWLIGQAKRYKIENPVQTADIRELVGSVELARTGGAIHSWAGLDLRPFDAVVQLFFTSGRFTIGADRLLARSGIVSMSGEQLATFLADCGVGIDGEDQFSESSFRLGLKLKNAI